MVLVVGLIVIVAILSWRVVRKNQPVDSVTIEDAVRSSTAPAESQPATVDAATLKGISAPSSKPASQPAAPSSEGNTFNPLDSLTAPQP